MTEAQANLLPVELGVVAACAVAMLSGAIHGAWKVKKTAEQVRDVAGEAVGKAL
jgi:hypothetical protein